MPRRAPVIALILVLLALSLITIGPRYVTASEIRTIRTTGMAAPSARPGDATGAGAEQQHVVALPPARTFACAPGRNGGATDVGVTGTTIKLAATVVRSGVGSSFLGEVPIALEAVKNQVNRAGGVCGRLLDLQMVDDSWRRDLGQRYIRQFIADGVFALAVSPSSEGLDAAIRGGDIARAGIPVVGADGMLISQYTEPWVWPVASSTISTMHVIAQDAAARGAKTFGLVWDRTYRFGVEGANAFRNALRRLFPGAAVLKADEGIVAGQPGYKEEVDRFNTACGTRSHPTCDFIGMLLEPGTALQWISDGGTFGAIGTGGPQPLFVNSFARSCGEPCNGMWVWSGYNPPIPPFDSQPGVARYVGDLAVQSSTVDVTNPFVEGGYVGMRLLVEALRRVGPDLTRARLKAVLDSMKYELGLTQSLQWSPGAHFANSSAHAFSIVVNSGSFTGWRYEQTGWVRDRWAGRT